MGDVVKLGAGEKPAKVPPATLPLWYRAVVHMAISSAIICVAPFVWAIAMAGMAAISVFATAVLVVFVVGMTFAPTQTNRVLERVRSTKGPTGGEAA